MQQSLLEIGVDLQVKSCQAADRRKFCAVAIQDRKDAGNAGYVVINGSGSVIAIDDLDIDDKEIKDAAIGLLMSQKRDREILALRVA